MNPNNCVKEFVPKSNSYCAIHLKKIKNQKKFSHKLTDHREKLASNDNFIRAKMYLIKKVYFYKIFHT